MKSLHDSAPSGGRSLVAWIILGLIIALYYFRFSANDTGMMALYSPAGDCLFRGERLVTCTLGFPYPPLFAVLMVPFTFLPMWARDLAWYGVLVGATYGSFRICEVLTVQHFRLAPGELVWVRILAVVLSLKFVLSVFENQAYDVLVFFFILVGLHGLSRNRTAAGAGGLAMATALKVTPALMFLYVLLLRKWKVFALGVVVCVIVSLLPDVFFTPKEGRLYLYNWFVDVVVGGLLGTSPEVYGPLLRHVNFLNQSLKSFIFGIVHGRLGEEFAPHARMILYVAYLVYGAAALAIMVLATKVEGALLWGASVILISMLMLSPMSSKSHFIVLLLPHMAIAAYLVRHREAWRAVVPLLCASFALNTLTSRALMGRELSNKMLSLGSITLGTLLLLAVVAVIVIRSRRAARANPAPAASGPI